VSISSIGATRGYDSSRSREPNAENVERVAEDRGDCKITEEKYSKLVQSFSTRFNILINEKIKDIKLYCIKKFKEEHDKGNIQHGQFLIHLDQVIENKLRSLKLWLRDMQFIWSFFKVKDTLFKLKHLNINLTNITTRRDSLEQLLKDIDERINEILQKKYKFTEESRGTHGGRRATQRKRTPRRRKVVQTRKKRY
jgi:hypothetical protein